MVKKEIVVIGGGSGAGFINEILKRSDASNYSVTLVSPHPYNVFMPATARMTVTSQEALEDSALISYDGLIARGVKFLLGRVSRVIDGAVDLEYGQSVKYDFLVVATGSSWEGPFSFPDGDAAVKEHIKHWREMLSAASSVVVIGGGAVGIGALST